MKRSCIMLCALSTFLPGCATRQSPAALAAAPLAPNHALLTAQPDTRESAAFAYDYQRSTPQDPERRPSVVQVAQSNDASPGEQSAAITAPLPTPSSSLSAGLDADEIAIWNDPEFKRKFAQTYLPVTEIEPSLSDDERKKVAAALNFMSDDKLNEAVAELQKLRGEKSSAVFDFLVGNIYFQQERWNEAIDAYSTATRKFERFRRAWKNLALIHIRLNEFDKAIPELTRVIQLGEGDSITYGLLGYAYSSVENNLSAESAYRMANLLEPERLDWKMGLARSFFRQERYADAVALTGQLLEELPDRTDLWLLQANAFIGLDQPMRAAENYEIVDQLGGSTRESLNMLADIYTNEELFAMAVDTYVRAMEADASAKPDRAIRAARVLAARGETDETRRLLESIDALHGKQLAVDDRKDLLKLQARLALAEGAGDEEARVLEEIVELDPLDGEALILLGQHAARVGDDQQAIFYYERAANIEKFEADAKVRHAQLLVKNGGYDDALRLLRSAQQINPRENVQAYLEQVERVSKSRG